MGYRTLLAILDTPKTTRQVTDFAVALANQFEGHVIGAHAEAVAMVLDDPDGAARMARAAAAAGVPDAAQRLADLVEALARGPLPPISAEGADT